MSSHPWIVLVVAGLLEAGWALGLKLSDGFTRPLASVLTIAAIVLSMWLLSIAARELPIGTAYAAWVGIGATGAAIGGALWLDERITVARGAFLVLMAVAIVGLKLTAAPAR